MTLGTRGGSAPRHGPSITAEDVSQSTIEAVTLAAKAAMEGFVSGVIDVGVAMPVVAPVFVALNIVFELFDAVKRHKDQLEELHHRCAMITTYVIVRCNTDSCAIDVTPLKECVEEIGVLASRYSVGGMFAKVGRYRRDCDRLGGLRSRIENLVSIMGLSGVAIVSSQVEDVRSDLECVAAGLRAAAKEQSALLNQVADSQNRTASDMQEARAGIEMLLARSSPSLTKPKLPPVPAGAPAAKGWHVVRDTLVDDIYDHFVAKDSPWMVGLAGRSGSGKSTAAALVVGGGMKVVRPQHGETHEQALTRLHRVRTLFPDGVVWLRVGRDAEERLPGLVQDLAKTVYEDVLDSRGYPPGQSPIDPKNGVAYVQQAMAEGRQGQGRLQCLLVADDVWQSEVLEELRKTGMRVLLTTRDPTLVTGAGGKVIVCDKLRKEEAKALVISAAELPEGARLPNAAHGVLDLCDYMPMYVESVARWTMMKGRRDEGPWSKAIAVIQRHLRAIQAEKNSTGSREGLGTGTGDESGSSSSSSSSSSSNCSADKRIAILRAGFECLGAEDAQSRRLYLSLAVVPGGHTFEVYEAAVLLFGHEHTEHDLEQAGQVVASLERWAILTVAGPGLYCMHDARSDFARRALMDAPAYVREEAVDKWQAHLSTLEVARSVEVYDLLELWQALERVDGGKLRALHPYDSAISALEISDPVYFRSAGAVAELYNQEGDFQGAAALMQRIWERCEGNPAANPAVSLTSLWHCIHGAINRGDVEERRRLVRYMEPLLQCAIQRLDTVDVSPAEKAHFVYGVGLCCSALERMGEAERWFLRALEAQQTHLDADHAHVASTRNQLARCLLHCRRLKEAEALFRQALESREARLGINAMPVSRTLTGLAKCVFQMGRAKEAELLFRRVLAIQKSRLGVEHVEVAHTLGDLAECLSQLGQAGEAETLSRQALEIKANCRKRH